MEFEKLILNIVTKLENVQGYKKSIVQADLGNLSDDIEEGIFKLRISESNYRIQKFPELQEQNIQTIAEFIENEAIYKIIKEIGVDFSQGYYFGKPEPLLI